MTPVSGEFPVSVEMILSVPPEQAELVEEAAKRASLDLLLRELG